MSTTQVTIVHENNQYKVVSTAQVGPPGPNGAPGGPGPKGSSGLPGTDAVVAIDHSSGDPVVTVTTHWWIDTDGSIHYEDNPADVPAGKEGWFDPATFSVIAGLPGTEFRVISFNGSTGTIVVPEDGSAGTPGLRSLGTGAGQALPGNTPVQVVGSNAWLISAAKNEDMDFSSCVWNSDGVLMSANITWRDGSTGVYAADSVSSTFKCVNGYHFTYVGSAGTKTVTQPTVTRDSTTGLAADPPSMIIS